MASTISPTPLAPGGPLPSDVERWGQIGLWAGLVVGLGLTLVLAWQAPGLIWAAPLTIVAVGAMGWLVRHPFANLTVLLSGFVVVLDSDTGLQLTEIAYGLYYYAFLFYWYSDRLLRHEPFVLTTTDRIAALLLIFGLGGGTILGILFGAPLGGVRGEAMAFAMLLLYFPVKETCRQERYGPEILFAVVVWVGLFVTVRNLLNFREIILAATEAWQVSDARPGLNEMQLLIPALGALVLLIYARGWLHRISLLGLLLALTGALIMTKARGYWIDYIFGVGALFFLLQGRYRWKLLTLMVVGAGSTVAVAFIFFGDLASLVFSGAAERFSTLGTALTDDVSLVNRFHETATVWERIKINPILGYGFGTEFRFFDWVYRATFVKSFMHNGYTALWFKIGIWGMILMMLFWIRATWHGLLAYRSATPPLRHRLIALSMALTLIAIIPSVSTSNPFIVIHQVYTFTLQVAIAVGIHQRYFAPASLRVPDTPGTLQAGTAESG